VEEDHHQHDTGQQELQAEEETLMMKKMDQEGR